MTALDDAHGAMDAAPDDDAARMRFFDRLVGCELFLLLETEATGDKVVPRVFPLDGADVVLVFDREDRLTAFTDGPAPYAGLSGRALVGMLAGQGIGLGVNLGVAPSSMLLEAPAIEWLAATLAGRPDEVEARAEEVLPPAGLPETLLTALDARLASAKGLAQMAYLVAVRYADGTRGHLMAFVEAVPGAEAALAQTVSDALIFSGVEAGSLDVGFFRRSDPMAARLARVGLRFDLPVAEAAPAPRAPGGDPAKPPILR